MSDTTDNAEALNSSDYEIVHDDQIKNTINKFLQDDVDCDSLCGTALKRKTSSLRNETTEETGSQSERAGTEISADDVRDILSEESRGSEFSRNSDEYDHRLTNRLSTGNQNVINGACSHDNSIANRNKKSEKDLKLYKKSSNTEHKPRHDNSKSLHNEKSHTNDKKQHHSGRSHNSCRNSHHDGISREKIHHSVSNHVDNKSFTNDGRKLLGREKYVQGEVKGGVQDRRTLSESTETESVAVNVRDVLSEDSQTSGLLDDFVFDDSRQGWGAETMSIASRSNTDERSSPCDSTTSHDMKKLQHKDVKKSSNCERKSWPDNTLYHTEKSRAVDNRSQHGDKTSSCDKKSHHNKSKTLDSRSGFDDKKSQKYGNASGNSDSRQLLGYDKSVKKEDFLTKTSKNEIRTGSKARTSKSEILSEDSQTSELWAGFALGGRSHSRTTDRLSITSKSDADEVSSHCGSSSSYSRGTLPKKERKKLSSDAEGKLLYGEKKSHRSDKSSESGKKSHHGDKLRGSDHSSNDKSHHIGKPPNSSSNLLLGVERQSVKEELIPNVQASRKSSKGLAFFSSSAYLSYGTCSSSYKSPNVKITSKPDAATQLGDSPPVFTKVKINGVRVFIERPLRRDPKLWLPVRVTLVNCDHVLAESLAKEHETLALRKDVSSFSSVSKASSRNSSEQKTSHKEKRASENSSHAGKNKNTCSKDSGLSTHTKDGRQSDYHMLKKSFDKMQSENSDKNRKSDNKKSSKDSDKKTVDRSKSRSESRSRESSISRSHKSSDVRHESKSHDSRKLLHESKSNHSGKSKHDCESRHRSSSHSKSKSDHKNRSHHDSKSSSHQSKSLLGKSVQNSTLQQSPSRCQSNKELKMNESKSQSGSRDENTLHAKSDKNCKGKTTAGGSIATELLKPAKKRINVFQSDSDDSDLMLDSKENICNKKRVIDEHLKPICNEPKDSQNADDDLSQIVHEESIKDAFLPSEKQQKDPGKLEHDNKTEEHRYADDSSSWCKETADVKRASIEICSISVNNELTKGTTGLSEGPVKQSELESAKEISVPLPDTPLEQCRSEEPSGLSAVKLENVKMKPESDRCSDLVQMEQVDKPSVCQITCSTGTADGKEACHVPRLKSECSDYPQFSEASNPNQSSPSTFEVKDEGSVSFSEDQLSRGAGDCVTSRERHSSDSYDRLVPSLKGAADVSCVDDTTRTTGTEPVTKVCVKTPLPAQSYDLEKVKKDVRMQPFVKLKVLEESFLKKLLADYENSVRRKSLATVAAKDFSNLSNEDSVPQGQSSSSSISSLGKSEIKDEPVEKKVPLTGDKEAKEKKKRSCSSTVDVSAAEPPAQRLKLDGDVKTEQLNSNRKKDSSGALPETIAKSLQKAKAEFKRKGGYPSEMVRDDVKRHRMAAEKADSSVVQWLLSEQDEKKMNSLSFVIPKVKPGEKPDKAKKKKAQEQLKEVWIPPSAPAISMPQTPKPPLPPKTLTEEDKGRSVLAKLEDMSAERENMRWETRDNNSWKGKTAVCGSKRQPFNTAEDQWKMSGQNGPRWRNFNSGAPRNAVNGTIGSAQFQRWSAGSSSGYPRNRHSSSFNVPRQSASSQWQGVQQPAHSVTNEKGGSSSRDWVRLYNRDPLRLEDPSATDDYSAAFSPPAVADDDNDDVPNDRKVKIPSRQLSTDNADSMVEHVRVLAEAIQEVLVEGSISSARRDKLVDIYAKLQRNLSLPSDTLQGNASLLNAFCDSSNQTLMTIDVFKDLLQCGSTPSQLDNASALLNLPPVTNEGVRSDTALLAARDVDLRDSRRVAVGYQDVDHRKMDARCNPLTGFDQRVLSSAPVSSSGSPRCPVIGKSNVVHGSIPVPIAATHSSGSSELCSGRGLVINPNATFMDVDERNSCLKDIDERKTWVRTLAERELGTQITTNETKCSADLSFLQKSGDSVVLTLQQSTAGVDACKTVLAQEGTVVNFKTETVSSSPSTVQPEETKPLETREVSKSEEVLRQEAIASRMEDELQLLEMLVTIQCELASVNAVPETSNDTPAADLVDPTPVPEQASKTSDKIPTGTSSVVSNSPMCAMATNSVVDEESQDGAARLSCKGTPQEKPDDEKAAARSKALEDRVVNLARNALKPFYHKSQITSEEFKLIMRKAIAKIKVRDGEELKESKVTQLIHAYVDNIIHRRKKMTL